MILLKTIAVVVALIGIAFLGLGVRIWIRGKFADTEVESNENMKSLGLQCAKQQEWEAHCQANGIKGVDFSCSSCSSHCD